MQRPMPEMPAPMMPILEGWGESMGRLGKGKGGKVLPISMQENDVELLGKRVNGYVKAVKTLP
jgi:hypothetical protein